MSLNTLLDKKKKNQNVFCGMNTISIGEMKENLRKTCAISSIFFRNVVGLFYDSYQTVDDHIHTS